MPTIATMSGAQFDALPYEEGRRWELLEGELIEAPSATPRHQIIVKVLLLKIELYLEGRRERCLIMPDVEFALSDSVRLRPDVCVLLPDKAIELDLDRIPIPGSPDLAIEIICPTERTAESRAKVDAYLRYGVAEVWQIYPKSRVLEIYKGENGHRNPERGTAGHHRTPARLFRTDLVVLRVALQCRQSPKCQVHSSTHCPAKRVVAGNFLRET